MIEPTFPKSFPAYLVAAIRPTINPPKALITTIPLDMSLSSSMEIAFIVNTSKRIAAEISRIIFPKSLISFPASFVNFVANIKPATRDTAPFPISSQDILDNFFIALDKISKDAEKERMKNPSPLTFTESLISIFDTAKERAARTTEIAAIAPTDSRKEPESNLARI